MKRSTYKVFTSAAVKSAQQADAMQKQCLAEENRRLEAARLAEIEKNRRDLARRDMLKDICNNEIAPLVRKLESVSQGMFQLQPYPPLEIRQGDRNFMQLAVSFMEKGQNTSFFYFEIYDKNVVRIAQTGAGWDPQMCFIDRTFEEAIGLFGKWAGQMAPQQVAKIAVHPPAKNPRNAR